jgi:cytochrome c-type biogenesis protein CcsB
MISIFIVPALICYAAASAGFIVDRAERGSKWGSYAALALMAGAVFHALDLAALGIRAGNIPVSNFAQSLSFLAWLTALIGFVLIVRLRMDVIGAYVAPAVTVAALISCDLTHTSHIVLPHSLQSVWLPIHVTLALLGYALFVLAAAVSFIYLACESRLKSKRLAPGGNLPSLEKLDRVNYRLLGWGFLMLSLAIISGAIWADARSGKFWSWEPVESWSLVIWILYAALLESRITVGWRGRRAAALTIVVFGVLLGSFVGVNLAFPGKHAGTFVSSNGG